jgi:hypothetical protein
VLSYRTAVNFSFQLMAHVTCYHAYIITELTGSNEGVMLG